MGRAKLPLSGEDEGETFEGVFKNLIPGNGAKRRNSIALLAEIEAVSPEKLQQFYNAIEAGATFRSAAGFLGVRPETLSRWLDRGRTAKSGPYRRFYDKALSYLQIASAFASMDVKKRDPMAWLTRGPGKLVGDDWSDQPTQVNVEVSGGVTTQGMVRVETVDMVAALKEIQKAGIPLEALTRTHSELANLSTSLGDNDEDTDDVDSGESSHLKRGTNFVEGGTYLTHNPSLPDTLAEQVEERSRKKRTIQGESMGSLLASLGLADEADNADAKTIEGRVLYSEDKAKRNQKLGGDSSRSSQASQSPSSERLAFSSPETNPEESLSAWGADWEPLEQAVKSHPRAKEIPASEVVPEPESIPEQSLPKPSKVKSEKTKPGSKLVPQAKKAAVKTTKQSVASREKKRSR